MDRDSDILRQRRMLLWLADRPDGIYGFEEIYAGDSEAPRARRDVAALEQQGLVRPAVGRGPSLETVQASITPAGRQRAADLASVLRDRSQRSWACREGLLKWLYQVDAADSVARARIVTDFLDDDLSIFVAERFTAAEVDRASGWLAGQHLIDGLTIDQAEGPVRAYLLDQGARCVEEYDGNIRRYREAISAPRPTPSSGPVVNVNASNVQVATGDRSEQRMTVTQVPEQLVDVIDGIAEILKALGVVAGQESELEDIRGAAIADVTSDAPTAKPVRRFRDWVIECVKQGGTAAAVAAVTAASNGMLHDAEALVHALGG